MGRFWGRYSSDGHLAAHYHQVPTYSSPSGAGPFGAKNPTRFRACTHACSCSGNAPRPARPFKASLSWQKTFSVFAPSFLSILIVSMLHVVHKTHAPSATACNSPSFYNMGGFSLSFFFFDLYCSGAYVLSTPLPHSSNTWTVIPELYTEAVGGQKTVEERSARDWWVLQRQKALAKCTIRSELCPNF